MMMKKGKKKKKHQTFIPFHPGAVVVQNNLRSGQSREMRKKASNPFKFISNTK